MNNDIFKDYSSLDCSYLKDYILYSTKEVKEIDIMVAKEMNIPIVVIYTEFYKEAIQNISSIDNDLSETLYHRSTKKYAGM